MGVPAFRLLFYNKVMKQNKELKDMRKQWFGEMEQKLRERYPKEEDRIFSKSPIPFA